MTDRLKRMVLKIKNEGIMRATKNYMDKMKKEKKELELIRNYHLLTEKEKNIQKKQEFNIKKRISIITPLYNTPKMYLIQLVESVLNQTYEEWELCLADGSDFEHAYVEEICQKYTCKDKRIIYKKLKKNEGIVGNTNQAIKMATGDFFGLLDHDDILHESALYECMNKIQEGADFIYTDEMKFNGKLEDSKDIICKSGFGKDELRSHNYICHFVVFDKCLLEGMNELYRRECEGSQDYDMVLRLTEKAKKIIHIPKILYYWRVHEGSVAQNLSVKQYAVNAAKKAISDQLKRSKEKGKVECNYPYETIYRIEYELLERPLVSICIWGENKENRREYIEDLLKKTEYRPLEIITASDNEEKILNQEIKIISVASKEDKNRYEWFEKARSRMTGEYQIYVQDECLPKEVKWIEELLMYAQRSDVGAVGAYLTNKDKKVYFAGGLLDYYSNNGIHVINYLVDEREQGYEANMRHVRNTTFLSSMCMMVSTSKMKELGGFRTDMDDCGDIDLCLRSLKQNNWNVWNCFAKMTYNGKRDLLSYWGKYMNFRTEWKETIEQGDIFYHPMLKKLNKI